MGNVILNDWTFNQPKRSAARVIRGRYDAATVDSDSRRHWANSDGLSARQANSSDVRMRLRNHARYEVANNCYARGIVNTLADVVIGYGPTLTIRRDSTASASQSEALRITARLFNEWAEEINLWGKLWTMRVAKCQDGEAFAVFRNNQRLESLVQLDLQLIEAEQVTDSHMGPSWSDPNHVDGIEVDDFGNPVWYHVLRQHPSDLQTEPEPVRIRPNQMVHWFRCDRPGQLRGVPEITPALPLFAQLRRFTMATLTAAETAADMAALLKTNAPSDDEDLPHSWEEIPIARGMMLTLPEGYDMAQMRAEHPTTTYEMFKREILCEIGRCLQLPRMMTLMDASGYNYSSGRLDKQASDRAIDVDRYGCELQVLRKIWAAWFEEAQRISGYLPPAVEGGLIVRPRWLWQELGHVDRQKEASGAAQDLQNNTTTLADECARVGLDWEEVLQQRAREVEMLRSLGLTGETGNDQENEPAGNESEED